MNWTHLIWWDEKKWFVNKAEHLREEGDDDGIYIIAPITRHWQTKDGDYIVCCNWEVYLVNAEGLVLDELN